MDALLQDLRYAMRMVAKSPGTTAIALLTIGIATGANATVFGFVSALLLRPAPGVADPGSLVSVYTSDYSSGPYGDLLLPRLSVAQVRHPGLRSDGGAAGRFVRRRADGR